MTGPAPLHYVIKHLYEGRYTPSEAEKLTMSLQHNDDPFSRSIKRGVRVYLKLLGWTCYNNNGYWEEVRDRAYKRLGSRAYYNRIGRACKIRDRLLALAS